MDFIKASMENVPEIMEIITQAQQYFKNNHIDQWQDGYPDESVIKQDIEENASYAVVNEDAVIATAALLLKDEPTYDFIYNGRWLTKNNARYGTVHRIAVAEAYKGQRIASKLIAYLTAVCRKQDCSSIRIDTHEDNHVMQRMLKKEDFSYCGIIYLEDGSKRLAYEKLI